MYRRLVDTRTHQHIPNITPMYKGYYNKNKIHVRKTVSCFVFNLLDWKILCYYVIVPLDKYFF